MTCPDYFCQEARECQHSMVHDNREAWEKGPPEPAHDPEQGSNS